MKFLKSFISTNRNNFWANVGYLLKTDTASVNTVTKRNIMHTEQIQRALRWRVKSKL